MQNTQGKTALGLDVNLGALICYIGNFVCYFGLIYSIIVLVQDKTNKLVRFHAWQSILGTILGLVLFAVAVVAGSFGGIIDSQIGFPVITLSVGLVVLLISLVFAVYFIIAMIKSFKGEIYKVPILGGFAEKWS